ncbi:hypothetical protein GUJ93_ZPchr0009g202 [Zizania palustris]|uniref:Uncharacterized protein n=1 Tax=Zizania palustris TaxID=103762 RepID=A0A8J5V8S7_ZIZPA|nr:hypothetical protein GUJ93_ZPchr0009g202 [Zizania palustris]
MPRQISIGIHSVSSPKPGLRRALELPACARNVLLLVRGTEAAKLLQRLAQGACAECLGCRAAAAMSTCAKHRLHHLGCRAQRCRVPDASSSKTPKAAIVFEVHCCASPASCPMQQRQRIMATALEELMAR